MHRGSEVSLSFFYEYETVKLLLAAEDFLTSMKPVLWTCALYQWLLGEAVVERKTQQQGRARFQKEASSLCWPVARKP